MAGITTTAPDDVSSKSLSIQLGSIRCVPWASAFDDGLESTTSGARQAPAGGADGGGGMTLPEWMVAHADRGVPRGQLRLYLNMANCLGSLHILGGDIARGMQNVGEVRLQFEQPLCPVDPTDAMDWAEAVWDDIHGFDEDHPPPTAGHGDKQRHEFIMLTGMLWQLVFLGRKTI